VQKWVGTILNDGINKYFLSILCDFLWPQFRNLIVTLCMVSYNLNTFNYMNLVFYLVNTFNQIPKLLSHM
jgi:hypothetical protein